MPVPRFEVPLGTVDGVNTTFFVSMPYQVGSTAVFLNGLLTERSLDDGWFETDPSTGEITLKEAPKSIGDCPDVIQVFYLDTSPALPETEVTPLEGLLVPVGDLFGMLGDTDAILGAIAPAEGLFGEVSGPVLVSGVVVDTEPLSGLLEVCD
jgi:hypothetical protein